jgi:hypothetical protein
MRAGSTVGTQPYCRHTHACMIHYMPGVGSLLHLFVIVFIHV